MYLAMAVMTDEDTLFQFFLNFTPRPRAGYLKRFISAINMVKSEIAHTAIVPTDLTLPPIKATACSFNFARLLPDKQELQRVFVIAL